jgi:ParB-like chromosome segregation protein Spo0J
MTDPSPDMTIEIIPTQYMLPPKALCRLVDRKSLAYLELRDSIADLGILNSCCVRLSPKKKNYFEIVDGLQRWCCCRDLRIHCMPCVVVEADDATALRMQIQANAVHSIVTPVAFAMQLKRLFAADPMMNFSDMGALLNKRPSWIRKILGLSYLVEDIGKRVDEGVIPLASAHALARLPKWMQVELEEEAFTTRVPDFVKLCNRTFSDYRNKATSKRKRNYYRSQFEPHPYLQFYRVLVAEWKHQAVGPLLLVKNNITSPLDAWNLALAWALHMDPDSLEHQRIRQREREDAVQHSILARYTERKTNKMDHEMVSKLQYIDPYTRESLTDDGPPENGS